MLKKIEYAQTKFWESRWTRHMFACFFSCILDAYSARWRSMICNKFFPERAKSRSRYLYKKIMAGRGQRRFQLRLIAIREKFKADRLLEISIGGKLGQYWNGLMGRLGIQARTITKKSFLVSSALECSLYRWRCMQ